MFLVIRWPWLVALLAAIPTKPLRGQECGLRPGAPRLDHVVIAVRDLDSLAARFTGLGFRLKDGRPHANGLLNKHVKFRDGTEIELMTVAGPATDRMAREYQDLIANEDAGAYVALRTEGIDSVAAIAARLGFRPRQSASGPWRFVSFEPRSGLGAIFFVQGGAPPHDADSVFAHSNGSVGLSKVVLLGGHEVVQLLGALGAGVCPGSGYSTPEAFPVILAGGTTITVNVPFPGPFSRPLVAYIKRADGPPSREFIAITRYFLIAYQ